MTSKRLTSGCCKIRSRRLKKRFLMKMIKSRLNSMLYKRTRTLSTLDDIIFPSPLDDKKIDFDQEERIGDESENDLELSSRSSPGRDLDEYSASEKDDRSTEGLSVCEDGTDGNAISAEAIYPDAYWPNPSVLIIDLKLFLS